MKEKEMKRSELNMIMKNAVEFINEMNFKLPPFAYWTLDDWQSKNNEYIEIKDNMLGWDITDFGSGNYSKIGLLMFTLRNGNIVNSDYKKTYAEKLLIVEEKQITPFHFHWNKMEDIINRGGGNLLVQMYNSSPDEELDNSDVLVSMDGRSFYVKAGSILKVKPGESITLMTRQYHSFWGEEGTGKILLGEVSKVNNDNNDNRFLKPTGRFPKIEEDEKARYLLSNEYEGLFAL